MINKLRIQHESERGIALITALLATTVLLALGIAVVFSASTDMVTTKIQRVGQQAFFAADGGIGVARRALAQSFAETMAGFEAGTTAFYKKIPPTTPGQLWDVQLLPPTEHVSFYKNVVDRAEELATAEARVSRMDALNGSSFAVEYSPVTGTVEVTMDSTGGVETATFRYSIQVTGGTGAGGNARVHETGRLSITTTLLAAGGPTARDFKFSGFGAFFDNGDTQANAPLASGTFSGPVHTNNHFAFLSSRSVTFRNVVSQVDNQIRYDNLSNTTPNRDRPPPNLAGITLSPEGFKQIPRVPLPTDVFSQEYAVINNTGILDLRTDGTPVDPPNYTPLDAQGHPVAVFDAQGRVVTSVLAANLRNAANNPPAVSGSSLVNGVYVSSFNGTSIAGAGIYVQGDLSDLHLYADTNGDQVYVLQQSGTTTTVRTSYATSTTTVSSGSTTNTYTGVFMDRSDPNHVQTGVSLFVNGNINSLRGGKDGSTLRPAISASTRLTITSNRHITVTGDIKYANPVTDSDGVAVTGQGSLTNVLGIYTNDGNLKLAPNSSYVEGPGLGIEINGAVVTFNGQTSNDAGAIEGSIVYTGSLRPGTNDRWRLVGSRVQAKINTIGYNFRDIYYDTRFSGGRFAPPFFPGTTYTLGPPPISADITIQSISSPAPTAMSWFRDNN